MAEVSAGSPSARQQHSWHRPPAWPDGRLLHPSEDPTTRVTIGALMPLVAIWVWALGRVDYFEASVGDWWWILAAGLIAASVVSLLAAKRRIRNLAARSGLAAVQPQYTHRRLRRVWRAARWSDGRLVAVRDPAVTALMLAGTFALFGTLWLSGNAGIPRIAISGYQQDLLLALQLPVVALLWAMVIRTQVVRAVVEGWLNDDAQLGFIERRIAALAANAKRTNARFATTQDARFNILKVVTDSHRKCISLCQSLFLLLGIVPGEGFEPSHPRGRRILSPLRLPVPPSGPERPKHTGGRSGGPRPRPPG